MRKTQDVWTGPLTWLGVLVLSSAAAGAAWIRAGLPLPGCPLRDWTGVPCAACGTTRMLRALVAGDLASAVAFHPIAFAGGIGLVVWAVVAMILVLSGRSLRPIRPGARAQRAIAILAAILVVLSWAYQIWRHA